MSAPTPKCPKCQFSLPSGKLTRCPFCRADLGAPRATAAPPPPTPPPTEEDEASRPPSDIIRLVKKEVARELFGDSDVAQLEEPRDEGEKAP